MGKNQNWQRRVESAEARRQEQRARKARKGDRESYRAMASDLMSYLSTSSMDGSDVSSAGEGMLHVWIDSPPQTANKDSGGGGDKSTKKKQGRKQQEHEDQCFDSEATDDVLHCGNHFFLDKCTHAGGSPSKGNKNRASKATACKLYHLEDAISSILKEGGSHENDANIAASADAATPDAGTSTDGSINMLWYLNVAPSNNGINSEKDAVGSIPPNEALQTCLSRNKVGAGTIVYVVWGQWLLYDRNRGGVLQKEFGSGIAEALFVEDGSGGRRRRRHGRSRGESMGSSVDLGKEYGAMRRSHGRSRGESMGSGVDLGKEYDARRRLHGRSRGESMTESEGREDYDSDSLLLHFPGSVHETILTYLPDIYTGNLPLVCKSWYAEIGTTSPNLWRQLLVRRGLPLPSSIVSTSEITSDVTDQPNPRDVCRDAFIGHYEALRDMRSISELFRFLVPLPLHQYREQKYDEVGRFDTLCPPNDATMMPYNSNPGAPRGSSGRTTSVKIWSDGKVIMSCRQDCTLHLFEAVNNGGSLACRQTVCVNVSPEPKSKRGRWLLIGMNLDDEYVCAICNPGFQVSVEDGTVRTPYMHIIRRDDILCASGGGDINRPSELEDGILSINLREELIDYLSTGLHTGDVEDARDAILIDYIENGDCANLGLRVCPDVDIIACGHGRFLFMVEIWVPVEDAVDIGVFTTHFSYRIFLYSTEDNAFVWSANAKPLTDSVSYMAGGYANLSSSVLPTKASLPFHTVICFPDSPQLMHLEVHNNGRVCFQGASIDAPLALMDQLDTMRAVLYREVSGWNDIWRARGWEDISEVERDGMNYGLDTTGRPALVISSAIVVAHNVSLDRRFLARFAIRGRPFPVRRRAVLTFSPPEMGSASTSLSSLTLKGDAQVLDMHPVRSDHIMLLCRTYAVEEEAEINRADVNEADNGGVTNANASTTGEDSLCIVLIHVQSRTEIARYNLMHCTGRTWPPPQFVKVVAAENTIALEVVGRGMIMSGRGVRNVLNSRENLTASSSGPDQKQAKKKKPKKRMAKKDGFARGMARYVM